jgi:hypothetical protein
VNEDNQIGSSGIEVDEAAGRIASLFGGDADTSEDEEVEGEEGVEDESEEDGAEGEDEPEEGDEDEETQQAQGQTYTVKIDGKEAQVPLAELINGYQRTADYTRKSMAVAEQRKAVEAEVQQLRAERAQFAAWTQELVQHRQQQAPPQVDWDRLRAEDPIQYAQAWADHQRFAQEQQRLMQQHQVAVQRNQQAQQEEKQRILEIEGQRLAEIIPEFGDPQKVEATQRALLSYGKSQGFNDEELANVYDHRTVAVLRKAMLYDQLQAQRPQVQQRRSSGPVAAPGSNGQQGGSSFRKHVSQLRKTGSVADAAAAIAHLF